MYCTQINSRDLLFSNPVDRFLGNEAGLKTSLESGISSSFSYSQNEHTKDFLSGNSGEIFSQTPKTISEPQANTDYQKYISQNLLFGKNGRSAVKYGFGNKENESNGKKSPFLEKDDQEMHGISEIKSLVESLHDGIKRLNADISDVKDSVKGMEIEITRQNERISSFENAFSQQTKIMEANDKYLKKSNKEEHIIKLQKLVTEIASQKINITNSTLYKTPFIPNQNTIKNTFQSTKSDFSRPLSITSNPIINSSYGIKRENSVLGKLQGSVHTPLMEVMKRNQTPSVTSYIRQNRNQTPSGTNDKGESPEIIKEIRPPPYLFPKPSQQYSRRCTRFNVKQKCTTPSVTSKHSQQRNVQRSTDFCSSFESDFKENPSIYTKKNIANSLNNRNLRSRKCFKNYETDTLQSSPYLTVIEATTLAEEFSFL